jgi:hypothetical protein
MRIGVLADIHGNLRALAAVQADLQKYSSTWGIIFPALFRRLPRRML